MRDRHIARVCRSCDAPLGRQEDACWRCGAGWADAVQPRMPLRVITGGWRPSEEPWPVAAEAAVAASRWTDEGGHL